MIFLCFPLRFLSFLSCLCFPTREMYERKPPLQLMSNIRQLLGKKISVRFKQTMLALILVHFRLLWLGFRRFASFHTKTPFETGEFIIIFAEIKLFSIKIHAFQIEHNIGKRTGTSNQAQLDLILLPSPTLNSRLGRANFPWIYFHDYQVGIEEHYKI